ncbi:MAG: helix-turn-helix transcriptional regulator [Clostridia bacterium]|nr:helix-turn-helix transcriptional regulator [Clostridia bacterium]
MAENLITGHSSLTRSPDPGKFPLHTHGVHEIFYFVRGDAGYSVEGGVYPLRSGDVIVTRRSESHRLLLKSSAPYERIVVNFDPSIVSCLPGGEKLLGIFDDRALGEANRYEARLFPDNRWGFFIRQISSKEEQWQKKIYLLALLEELYGCFPAVKQGGERTLSLGADIIAYVNEHLFEPLTLDSLAGAFYLSRSQLNRVFRRDAGATVHSYILIKRLLAARRLIRDGASPTEVSQRCGFLDYVGFYKAYKKQFGHSPKTDRIRDENP